MKDPVATPGAPTFIDQYHEDAAAIRAELVAGLRGEPASASPKHLYDTLGSRLFEAITELPEYYPTRTEAAIFAEHGTAIAGAAGPGCAMIDLGAGNCEKASGLFEKLRPAQYVAVDISTAFLRGALGRLQRQFPGLPMVGLGADFSNRLELPSEVRTRRRLFFYPGSSLGNFTPSDALVFLRRLRALAGGDGALLIGIDLVKDKAVLDAAYDDALGVTAAFNLNLLRHLNALLGADFDLRDWRHVAFFDPALSRIEMHLEARRAVSVALPDGARRFAPGERIHTENSYKYRIDGFAALLVEAGFAAPTVWTDAAGWFAVCLARAT